MFLTREIPLGQLITLLTQHLSSSTTSYLTTQVLLAHVLNRSRAWILSHPEYILTPFQEERLSKALEKLENEVPLPYVLGHWEFYNLDFEINPEVLIPRPETELIVDLSIEFLKTHPESRNALDIGTGSGCIAISILYSISDLLMTAVDISIGALDTARTNAVKHSVVDRTTFVHGDLFPQELSASSFSLITANLPYIPTSTLLKLEIFGREPTLALDGGPNGLDLIHRFLDRAAQYISPGGLLLIEIEANQGKTALESALENFPDSEITICSDYSGYDRVLNIQT
jgi:release factor glutamine methyltransferase